MAESPDELLRRARGVIPLLQYEPANRESLAKSLIMYCGAAVDAHAGRNSDVKWDAEYTWESLDGVMHGLLRDIPASLAGRFLDALGRLRSAASPSGLRAASAEDIEVAAAGLVDIVGRCVATASHKLERP